MNQLPQQIITFLAYELLFTKKVDDGRPVRSYNFGQGNVTVISFKWQKVLVDPLNSIHPKVEKIHCPRRPYDWKFEFLVVLLLFPPLFLWSRSLLSSPRKEPK